METINAVDNNLIELLNRKIYLAGPMSGIPDRNHLLFFAAESYLKEQGAKVMNPAVLPKGFAHDVYSEIGIQMMHACEMVAFLPGWQESSGACTIFSEARLSTKLLLKLETDHINGNPWIKSHELLM